jgi:SNF2 family DNA or RNA helicase
MSAQLELLNPEYAVNAPKAWTPHAYQKRAIKWLLEHPASGLLLDPGLGKTSCVLGAIKILKKAGLHKGTVVIAPRRIVREVWRQERDKWTDFHGLSIGLLHGDHKDSVVYEQHDIYLMTYDGLEWLTTSKLGQPSPWSVLRSKVDTLVCDESSNVKHTNTQRYKRLRPLLPRFRRRWILTGSIAPNGLLDVFGQVYVADMGKLFGPYITGYRRAYFTPGGYGGYEWKITKNGEEAITAKLKGAFLRLDAEDFLELPPLSIVKLEVDLPPAARKTYNNLEANYFDIVDKESISAVNAGAALVKCRQVASGGVYNDDDTSKNRAVTHLHSEKTLALFNLVEELNGQPLLVFYSFQHDVTRILDVLGEDTPVLGGGTTDKQTAQIIADWNAGRITTLLAHPKSAGHGLNLQEGGCGHIAWYSMDYDWELHDQGTRRVRRQGNDSERIMAYYIMAKDTIDEVIFDALQYKAKRQNALLDSLKTYRSRRK